MKNIFISFILLSGLSFAQQFPILKIEDRITNELIERSEKYFKEYQEWQKEEHKKWIEEEKKWKKLGNKDYSRVRPKMNPNITYEEYREKGYLGNWLVSQVDLEDTIWGKLITVPQGTRMCGDQAPKPNGGIGGRGTWDLESRLDFIKETSRGYKMLPDEWISSLELKYINSACQINSLIIGPDKDIKKLKEEVEKIEKINVGLADDTTDSGEFFKGIKLALFLFIFLWFIAFGFRGFKFWGKKEKPQGKEDYSFFNYMMYKWWFK
ncbi:hypothetical protein ACNSOL_11935 (plasmid) [Aliarcobacter lanthieri]|uniref:hypothetical protein n=1 Tax=Aliarcobacter lanthieri TaxID=1355374 RepID=UPI003AAEF164